MKQLGLQFGDTSITQVIARDTRNKTWSADSIKFLMDTLKKTLKTSDHCGDFKFYKDGRSLFSIETKAQHDLIKEHNINTEEQVDQLNSLFVEFTDVLLKIVPSGCSILTKTKDGGYGSDQKVITFECGIELFYSTEVNRRGFRGGSIYFKQYR